MLLYAPLVRKLFVAVRDGEPLRRLGATFWEGAVEAAGEEVLARISSDACDAYLLRESSLFVHDDRALLISDGRASLTAAADEIRRAVPSERITTLLSGVQETRRAPIELTLDELDAAFCAAVERASERQDPGGVRALLRFETLFPGFQIEDRAFEPSAYSLVALGGAHYCALHIRLEGRQSWLSLDTSWRGPGASIDVVTRVRSAVHSGRRSVDQLY